jgi:hypothetical protein
MTVAVGSPTLGPVSGGGNKRMIRIWLAIVLATGALVPLAGRASATDYSFSASPDGGNYATVPDQTGPYDGSLAQDNGGYATIPFHVTFATSGDVRTAIFQAPETWDDTGPGPPHPLYVKWGNLSSGRVEQPADCHLAGRTVALVKVGTLPVVADGCGTFNFGPFPNLGSYKWTITLDATPAATPTPRPTPAGRPRPTPTITPRPAARPTPPITARQPRARTTPSAQQVLAVIDSPSVGPSASEPPLAAIALLSPAVQPVLAASTTSDPTAWIVIGGLILLGLLLATPEVGRTLRRRRHR